MPEEDEYDSTRSEARLRYLSDKSLRKSARKASRKGVANGTSQATRELYKGGTVQHNRSETSRMLAGQSELNRRRRVKSKR